VNKKRSLFPLVLAASGIVLVSVGLLGMMNKDYFDILLGVTGQSTQESEAGGIETPDPLAGHTVPDFELKSLSGETIRIADLRGHPVLINYWTTWCPPCREEMPLLQKRSEKYPDLVVLAIDSDEDEATVKDYIDRYGYTFTVLLDPDWNVERMLGVMAYPTSIFIDPEGIIRARYVGGMTSRVLDENLALIGVSK
jgi:thiol-disulfide isomerase/thioredoxin